MTYTAMHPTYMATSLGYGSQQQMSPLQFGQIPQVFGQQQVSPTGGMIQQEEQILPQEHLVNPASFWNKLARQAIRYGQPVARQILEAVQYQQAQPQMLQYAVQTAVHQLQPLMSQQYGIGLPQLLGQQALFGAVIQPEDQILPQEHLVNPAVFWTKVVRLSIRYGQMVVRQLLDSLLYQHQAQQPLQLQAVAQAQQLQQQYGQPFGQPAAQQYGQPFGQLGAQQYGMPQYAQQYVPQFGQMGASAYVPQHTQLAAQQYAQLAAQLAAQQYGQLGAQQYGQQYGQPAAQQYGQQYGQPAAQQYGTHPLFTQLGQPYAQPYAHQVPLSPQQYAQQFAQAQQYGPQYAQQYGQAYGQQYGQMGTQHYGQAVPQAHIGQMNQQAQQSPVLAGAGF
jgi:uncharacterized protein with PIN domain